MRYLGGKSRTRNKISDYINSLRLDMETERGKPVPYWEPFVGGGWVLEKIKGQPIFASDISVPLIELWRGVQNGWIPPKRVSRDEYTAAKNGLMEIKHTAFIGYGSTFGGKWFGGYAEKDERNGVHYAENSHNALLKSISQIEPGTHFFAADFITCNVPDYNCLIYCDPPYANTTKYNGTPKWNEDAFWERVRWLEKHGHTVVVSEYTAPADFNCVLEMKTKTNMNTNVGKSKRIERLFRYRNP